jgi:hypothetical protein
MRIFRIRPIGSLRTVNLPPGPKPKPPGSKGRPLSPELREQIVCEMETNPELALPSFSLPTINPTSADDDGFITPSGGYKTPATSGEDPRVVVLI